MRYIVKHNGTAIEFTRNKPEAEICYFELTGHKEMHVIFDNGRAVRLFHSYM